MNKKILFLIIGSIIVLLVIYILFFKEDKGIYAENDAPIPTRFQTYQNVTAAYQSDNFEVEEIFTAQINSSASPNPIRAYQSVGENIIIDCDARKDDDTKGDAVYIKINKKGLITDSLYIKYTGYWSVLIDGFMVHTDEKDAYFTTWPMDGDTTRHAFVGHNLDLQMSPKALDSQLHKIKQESIYYFIRSYVHDKRYFTATYYYIADKWQVIWQEISGYQSIRDSEDPTRYQNEIYRSGAAGVYLDTAVTLKHFHPKDSIKYFHIIGGGSPATPENNWRGIGFFEIKIDHDIFPFSISDLIIEKESYDGFKTRLYQVHEPKDGVKHVHTNFYQSPYGYVLYAPRAKVLYIIRKKTT